jgi:flagellar hook capping protein FlgD
VLFRVPFALSFLALLASASWPGTSLANRPLRDEALCTLPYSQFQPRIVADERGGAIVAWMDYRSYYRSENYAQRLRASGRVDPQWPVNGRSLANGIDSQDHAILAPDGSGGAIVAWELFLTGQRDNIIYVHHLMASGSLDPAWPTEGRALSAIANRQVQPAMASDGDGGAIIVWTDYRSEEADIYAQHVLASGTLDPSWPPDGRAICTARNSQLVPGVVMDDAGGAIIVWVDRRDEDEAGDLYAQHVLSTGVIDPAWPVDGRALCAARELQGPLVAVEDGAGGAIVAWTDTRSTPDGTYSDYYDIYAQHVLASGQLNPAWPEDGLAVCTAPHEQMSPAIVGDGTGGAFVAWLDARGWGADLYAQHLIPSGTDPAWPTDGLAICIGSGSRPAMVADGARGALLVWSDARSGAYDIYGQHIVPSGVDPSWTVDGLAMTTGPGNEIDISIDTDSHGRAVMAWRDDQNGSADIYAMQLHQALPVRPSPRHLANGLRIPAIKPGQPAASSIAFELTAPQLISITVFDVMGRAVRTIAERRELPAGSHAFAWDGADDSGTPLKQGVYLVRLSSQGRSVTRKHVVFH